MYSKTALFASALVKPALICRDIRDITNHFFTRMFNCKITVQQIFSDRQVMVRVSRCLIFPLRLCTDIIFSHNALYALVINRMSIITKFPCNSSRAICVMRFFVNFLNLVKQFIIVPVMQTGLSPQPYIKTASGHPGPAHHLCNRIFIAVSLNVEISDHFRFLAKKALAFFGNSFSCCGSFTC